MADNLMQVTFKADLTGLNMLDAMMAQQVSLGIQDTLEYITETYIPSRWSSVSPSSAGEPPAIVTGTLGGSIHTQRRDKGGHFSVKTNTVQWAVVADAEYAAALEFGVPERNLEPRPFLRPAIEEAEHLIGKYITVRMLFLPQKYGSVMKPFGAQRSYLGSSTIGAMG